MGFPALQFFERRQIGIGIIEPDNKTQGDLVVSLMIQKSAAIGIRQWPALAVNNAARRMLLRRNVPQFLKADAINLRLAILIEPKLRLEQFRKMSANTFGKERVFGVQLHPWHIIVFVAAIARNAHVASCYALDRAIAVVEDFGGSKSGKNFDTEIFSLSSKPAT